MKNISKSIIELEVKLNGYLNLFEKQNPTCLSDTFNETSLEELVDTYASFITSEGDSQIFKEWQYSKRYDHSLIEKLASVTSQYVKAVEFMRAQRLLQGIDDKTGYFNNIENCIDFENDQFQLTENDTLLLVGSGAFPMTLIQAAKETNAKVIGIDIDNEAVRLGKAVVNQLASEKDIHISSCTVDEIKEIKKVTHIIFSSTVPQKYEILNQLYDITNHHVKVSMRYGNDLKSIFNYPKQPVDNTKWDCVLDIHHPNQIFDVVFYQKIGDIS